MRGIFAITAAMLLAAGLLAQPADAQRERQQQQRDESKQHKQQMERTQEQMQGQLQRQPGDQSSLKLTKCQDLLGTEVQNFQDEELGAIEDIVLDEQRQEVSYCVLSSGGFLGIGKTFHAVPWSAFQVLPPDEDDDDLDLVLNVSADQMEESEGFDKDNWPDRADPQFQAAGAPGSQGYREQPSKTDAKSDTKDAKSDTKTESRRDAPGTYGEHRGTRDRDDYGEAQKERKERQKQDNDQAQPGQDIESRRVSKILGTEVATGQREQIGKIEDIVLDVNHGKVAYALVSVDDDMIDVEEGMVALPWGAVQHQGDVLVIQGSPDQLQELAFDDEQGLSRLENRAYAARLHDRLAVAPYWEGEQPQMARRNQNQSQPGQSGQQGRQLQVTGTIERIATEGRGRDQELILHVRTTEGEQMAVRVGPEWFAREQDVSFREGEQIVVTGFLTGQGQMERGRQGQGQARGQQQILMASVIQTQDQTIELRDSQGRPSWEQGEQARRPRNR